jgi:hypothetical protein
MKYYFTDYISGNLPREVLLSGSHDLTLVKLKLFGDSKQLDRMNEATIFWYGGFIWHAWQAAPSG